MGDNYYEILGLARDATSDEIRQAYFILARKVHPDANPDPKAKEKFIAIQEAYEVLNDKDRRAIYDSSLPDREYTVPLISTKVIMSNEQLPRLAEDQLVYALMDVECVAHLKDEQIPKSHYCFVIDRSTSMKGSRISMVKANLLQVLTKLRKDDLVSIVTFSDKAEIVLTPTPVSENKALELKINRIQCSGGTEIYKGLKSGVELLWQGSHLPFSRHLILFTDGHTYGGEEACFQLAKDAYGQGIMISALGFGHEWNDPFLDRLSALTGGSTLFVTSQEDLYNYLQQKVDNVETVYARNLTLEYSCSPQVSMRYCFRLQPEIMPLEMGKFIPLGNVYHGKKSQYLMEFLVHPIINSTEEIQLIKGRIKMNLGVGTAQSGRIILNMSARIKDNLDRENPPCEIVRAMSKLTLYQMQERSRIDVQQGQYLPAIKRMHYLASKVLSQGNLNLAKTALLEAENIYNEHHYSQDGDKRLKYGTKALFLLPEPKLRSS